MRNKKYNIIELQQNRKLWTTIKTELWDEAKKEMFKLRCKAVDMYIDDYSFKDIYSCTGISHDRITRLIARCLEINPSNGMQYGYMALIPYRRIKDEQPIHLHNTVSKARGSFKVLLIQHPELEGFIRENYFRQGNATLEKKVSPYNMHKKFLEECRRLKIQDYEYPFNTSDNAQRTFYTYLKQLEAKCINEAMTRENLNAQQKFFSTGKGKRIRPFPLAPFSVVQIDGHKIDMLYSVEVVNKHGEIIRMPAMRMWLIAVIDVATRTILGYSLTANENYNQMDVLHAIRNTIIPRIPIHFTLRGLAYPDNYGYPSLAIPATEWAMPNIIMLDNAKAHLAENVIEKLSTGLYCSLNFGSIATPETRGIVERVFKTLEESGYHRIVSTTGSNINDTRRANAEKDAVKYQITYDDITQLTEYFIALYNNSPHSSLDNQTPLECMHRRIMEAGMQPCIADTTMKQRVYELTNVTEIKTIRGSVRGGKRPYITYKGTEYRNDILSQSMGLIGQKLIVEINPDDISTIKAYFQDGTELGILRAVGEWGRKQHSLKTREEAMKLANYNKQKNNPFYAPLTELENELNERAEKERRSRTKAARLRAEQGKELIPPTLEPQADITPISTRHHTVDSYIHISEEEALRKKRESYTPEEMEAIMKAGSLEDAYNQGLI